MKVDRRKHRRFPVIKDLAEPVELFVMSDKPRELPSILTNLSSGGMCLVVFAPVTGDTRLKIVLNIPGFDGLEVEGHVAWEEPKGDTTVVGVRFSRISGEDARRINQMAEAYEDCELKLAMGVRDVCFRECLYWPLCHKSVKLKH
jgi:c-di-GMP-binding flagellar brake protein YcgR